MGNDKNTMVISVYSPHCLRRTEKSGENLKCSRESVQPEVDPGEMFRRGCSVYFAPDGRLKQPDQRQRVAKRSGQVSDGSRYAAQDCDMTGRREGKMVSLRYKTGLAVFQQDGRREGGYYDPRGAGEMSAGETKRQPVAAMSGKLQMD